MDVSNQGAFAVGLPFADEGHQLVAAFVVVSVRGACGAALFFFSPVSWIVWSGGSRVGVPA
eukprot:3647904-Lingulodinium_polyedra.AAC.1